MKRLRMAAMAASAIVSVPLAADAVVVSTSTTTTTGSGLDCSGAAASLGVIWPPNHTMVSISIVGVTTDSSLPAPSITITGIQQDEAVDALGSGNTAPDGGGVNTPTAQVRAERAGPGTGRLYFIYFTASDQTGATCTGMVSPFVPHDQGQGFTPTDTGYRYDSTQIPP